MRPSFGQPLVPIEHKVNWNDQPSRFKIYLNTTRLPLAPEVPSTLGTLSKVAGKKQSLIAASSAMQDLSYEKLSTLLRFTNGVIGRKLDINWNLDHLGKAAHAHATYSRPSASGGGMYPYELYLVPGRSRLLLPGIYHYDAAHHGLERLALGDVGGRVRAAIFEHAAGQDAEFFILFSLNFWKNYFKYHNFCYHVITQDLGAALATLQVVATSLDTTSTILLWFRDEILNRLLGLDTLSESVFAVAAIGSRAAASPEHESPAATECQIKLSGWASEPLLNRQSFQRSKVIFELPMIENVHKSTLIEDEVKPEPERIAYAHCGLEVDAKRKLPLPPDTAGMFDKTLLNVFLKRCSSWGKMSSHPALSIQSLAGVLHFVAGGQNYHSDVKRESESGNFTRIMLFVNHVEGLPPGVYSYDPVEDCLLPEREGGVSLQLQQSYFLDNYNMDQAAAVFAVVGSLERALEVFGNRGLRILNAEVGMVAQRIYMAASALSLGCGAVLGFDNIVINQLLDIEGSDQTSLLLILLGNERAGAGTFNYQLI
jgi:SagB-type dehydrogenase family enzyme